MMSAMSCEVFGDVPYNMLHCSIRHPLLTVYSEMHLSDALLVWLNAIGEEGKEPLSEAVDDHTGILKQIRISLLPLWYAAGKRRSCYFSELAKESIKTLFRLMENPPTDSIDIFIDDVLDNLRIRVTEYSKKVDLSGCPQVTSVILFLSLLPDSCSMDLTVKKSIRRSLTNLDCLSKDQSGGVIWHGLPMIHSFDAVEEVGISKCPRLHLESAIEFFSKSFPSLRKLRAAYLWNFKITTLHKLILKCPLISEVDISADITPLLPSQISVLSSTPGNAPPVRNKSFVDGNPIQGLRSYHASPLFSKITRLVFEGRSDIFDVDLQYISELRVSLKYINLKGCVAVTDIGISSLVRCLQLHSILVCDTSFGTNSAQALCLVPNSGPAALFGERFSDTLASKLQLLHIGGCSGVDTRSLLKLISEAQAVTSLCLRDTCLVDDVLNSFSGSSLEMLDVSNTLISGDCKRKSFFKVFECQRL